MTIRQINQTLDEGLSLKLITQAYSEIAAIKLKRIRAGIETNRSFFNEVSQVFHTVKMLAGRKRSLSPTVERLMKKNGRTISVLLTSNYRFYGEINNQLIQEFMLNSPKLNTDTVVAGKFGIDYLSAVKYQYPYQTIAFNTDLPDPEELANIVAIVKNYQQVLVFHSKFKSVLSQIPQVVDVTQTAAGFDRKKQLATNNPLVDFIMEPEVEKILEFFDSQIITLLLEQTFLESELSRTASRLITMDQAETKANEFISDTKKTLMTAKRSIINARIVETFGSFMQWRKKDET